MNHLLYRLLILLLATFPGLIKPLQAQTYNPFPGDYTFNFVFNNPGDTFLCSVKVDTVYALGGDSVYRFNRTMRLNSTYDWLGNCAGVSDPVPNYDYSQTDRVPDQPSPFGNFMFARPSGRYDFVDTLRQDTFRLETQLALGSSWTVNAQRGLTATLDSIGTETFFGVSDSVKYISLCNGKSIWLSRSYGLLASVPWIPIHHKGVPASAYPPVYELRGIDEIGLGTPRPSTADIFDFASGDRFQFHYELHEGVHIVDIDTTEYVVQAWGPQPTGMGGQWMVEKIRYFANYGPFDTTYSPPQIETSLKESAIYDAYLCILESSNWTSCTPAIGFGATILESSRLVKGKVQYDYRKFYCGTNGCVVDHVGSWGNMKIREGLGVIYQYSHDPYGQDVRTEELELICSETFCGVTDSCQAISMIITSLDETDLDIDIRAWQGAGENLHLILPEGKLTVTFYGLEGKRIFEREVDSSGEVAFPLSGLASGIYVVELRGNEMGVVRKKVFWGL